jgi:hypothetical protein
MALTPDGKTLYPMLEGALRADPDPRRRLIHQFDIRARAYSGRTWAYRTDAAFPDAVIGDMTAIDRHRFMVIERDDAQGADARQKKIYAIDLRRVDSDGYLVKRLVLDLLSRADRGARPRAALTGMRSPRLRDLRPGGPHVVMRSRNLDRRSVVPAA